MQQRVLIGRRVRCDSIFAGGGSRGILVKNITDYPSEIRSLRSRIPKEERADFIRDYKGLSKEEKNRFKRYLNEANLVEAGKIIGRDISRYRLPVKNGKKQQANPSVQEAGGRSEDSADHGLNQRIKNILGMYPLESDPQLVAEAAKRYESLAGFNQMNIVDKTRRILDVSQ